MTVNKLLLCCGKTFRGQSMVQDLCGTSGLCSHEGLLLSSRLRFEIAQTGPGSPEKLGSSTYSCFSILKCQWMCLF